VRCTLRPPEPPRGHGIGGPSASAPLCVSDRLGGMPHCGRLRDGPLRPPLPPPSPAGMTRRSPGAARPTSTSFFAGRRARDGAAATAAAFAVARRRPNATSDRTVSGPLVGRTAAAGIWALRVWWRGCPACMSGGAKHAVVRLTRVLRSCVCAHARDRSCDAPGAELASGVSVGLGVAPVGALRWLHVASVISVRV
jgi:hypothetical protein